MNSFNHSVLQLNYVGSGKNMERSLQRMVPYDAIKLIQKLSVYIFCINTKNELHNTPQCARIEIGLKGLRLSVTVDLRPEGNSLYLTAPREKYIADFSSFTLIIWG
jgi:hypothetical protein